MRISIIGSFRKYYNEIKELIYNIQEDGGEVLSPKNSKIICSIEDFVVFEADNDTLEPYQIQAETLNNILKSDLVYVYDPNGYVGRTTCYEIGVLRTTNIPLLFYEYPKDLPIKIQKEDIVMPEQLLYQIRSGNKSRYIHIEKDKLKNSMLPKNILLCGSMAFYKEMIDMATYLSSQGVNTAIPEEENEQISMLSDEEFQQFKKRVSSKYLSKIREKATFGILVMNYTKNGKANYIGANTLVEISMAFCWGRKIFILNDYYDTFKDELQAWGAICLKQNMDIMINEYKNNLYSLEDKLALRNQIKGQIRLNI